MLYSGLRGLAGSGIIAAIVILAFSTIVNARSTALKIWVFLTSTSLFGKRIAGGTGRFIRKVGAAALKTNWSNPLPKAIKVSLDQLEQECMRDGVLDDAYFLERANHLKGELASKMTDKKKRIDDIFKSYYTKNDIRVIKTRPLTDSFLLHLRRTSRYTA